MKLLGAAGSDELLLHISVLEVLEAFAMQVLQDWISVNTLAVYAIVFGYSALKSGALPLLAGVIAHQGALDPVLVGASAFLGGYLGDEARFTVARAYGDRLFASQPKIRRWIERAAAVLDRYGPAYIFLYRYPKGMRTIGAFPFGLSGMQWSLFTVLNAGSALVWSALLVGIGYLLGDQIAAAAESWWGTASVALLLVFLVASWLVFRRVGKAALTPADA